MSKNANTTTRRPLLSGLLHRTGRISLRLVGAWTLLLGISTVVVLTMGTYRDLDGGNAAHAEPDNGGWGHEAMYALRDQAQILSPVQLANACGLGASSCFRCHNGRRADEPDYSQESGPWHADHADVNYSCAGCHQGNPRILRQDLAHRGLLSNPISAPTQSCASCHGREDGARLAETYGESHPHLIRGTQ